MRTIRWNHLPTSAAAVIAIGAAGALWRSRGAPPVHAALWGVTMLASFVGWGSLVNLWLAPRRWMDWGLRAGWGMGLFVLAGGFLCLAHAAARPVLVAQVGLGAIAFLAIWARRWSRLPSVTHLRRYGVVLLGRGGLVALVAAAYAMAAFFFVAFLGNHYVQASDDPPLYFTLPESLVQAGSIFQPFAARRASLLGGQVYLHAAFMSVASPYYLAVVDAGIGGVVCTALLLGHVGRGGYKAWHGVPLGLAMLLLFGLLNVRVNTGSLMTGVAGVITLYRTVRVPFCVCERPIWPMETKRIVAIAGLTVLCIVLRTSNAAGVLPFVVLVFASDFLLGYHWRSARDGLISLTKAAAFLAGAFLLWLLPWSILLEQSCGTLFYPLGRSNITPEWTFLIKPVSLASDFVAHLFYGRPVVMFVAFAVAGLVPLAGGARNDLAALTVSPFVGLLAQAEESAGFGPTATSRYYFAYVVATALLVAASVRKAGSPAALVAVGLGAHLAASRDEVRDDLTTHIHNANIAIHEPPADYHNFEALTDEYRDVQSHVPAGATIATAVFEPFRFDFRRNQVLILDLLGGMGPKPGWPFKKGPEALDAYLLANGVRYLVWVDFHLPSEFYNRDHWTSHLSKVGTYLQGEAVLQLDAEDAIEKLSTVRRVAYRAHGMTVVDLSSPP